MDDVKRNIPPSNEHLMTDLKMITISIQNLRATTMKRIEELNEEMMQGFEINSTTILEAKLIERMNDIVKALTRQMAERHETKKNFRVLEKQMKNIYEIFMH